MDLSCEQGLFGILKWVLIFANPKSARLQECLCEKAKKTVDRKSASMLFKSNVRLIYAECWQYFSSLKKRTILQLRCKDEVFFKAVCQSPGTYKKAMKSTVS